jgi:hypothetical protein
MLGGMHNLRSLDWCIECRHWGLLDDWKVSHLREELEMIDQQCPYLEHLGLLDYADDEVFYAVTSSRRLKTLNMNGENALSRLFPCLKSITFHNSGWVNIRTIMSAIVLGFVLEHKRGIKINIKPWPEDDPSKIVVNDVGDVMGICELLHAHLQTPKEEFSPVWTRYIHWYPIFEIHISSGHLEQLDHLNIASELTKSMDLILRANMLSPEQCLRLRLPRQIKALSVITTSIPLSSIKHLVAQLNLQSVKAEFADTIEDKVVMVQSRRFSNKPFSVEWAPGPVMAFDSTNWRDMTMCYNGELLEANVGRAISRTSRDSRKLLELVSRTLFEDTTLKRVEIIAAYPLYHSEESCPRLFKI